MEYRPRQSKQAGGVVHEAFIWMIGFVVVGTVVIGPISCQEIQKRDARMECVKTRTVQECKELIP
jgi:hypothetical protein